jgi:hypothetical protein
MTKYIQCWNSHCSSKLDKTKLWFDISTLIKAKQSSTEICNQCPICGVCLICQRKTKKILSPK